MNKPLNESLLKPAAFGMPWGGGFYAGDLMLLGVLHGLVVAPRSTEITGKWHARGIAVPGACSCVDGMANTVAMAEAGSQIAIDTLLLEINGAKGWHIPARDELELVYRNLKPTTEKNWASYRDGDNPSSVPAGYPYTKDLPTQTSAAEFRHGGTEALEPLIYVTSSQYSESYAWLQYFHLGGQYDSYKKLEARARAVRLIQLSA